jgi:outer membrane lipoprotein-sorting protein
MKKYLVIVFVLIVLASFVSFAADVPSTVSAQDIIASMKAQQALITDMQADTQTTIVSNISMPGTPSKGAQTMTQTGHIWQKGTDRSKTEITSPNHQITITNGNMMTIISPDTGQKMTQDLSKGLGASGQGIDSTKALDYFDLTVRRLEGSTGEVYPDQSVGANIYVISGTPKQTNKFLGRMDFFIDTTRNVPVRVAMYDPNGNLMSLSQMEYESVDIGSTEVYVPQKVTSIVTMQMGSINTEMTYENVKVNQGINDSVFEE